MVGHGACRAHAIAEIGEPAVAVQGMLDIGSWGGNEWLLATVFIVPIVPMALAVAMPWWRRLRQPRTVHCPECGMPRPDAAASSSPVVGHADELPVCTCRGRARQTR